VAEPRLEGNLDAHHVVPRCLIALHERAHAGTTLDGEDIQAWLEWEMEAMRWRVPVEISRADLEELVERSAELLERKRRRLMHATDWQRWGSRGGQETVRRYGRSWMALLALRRWGKISAEDLYARRVAAVRGYGHTEYGTWWPERDDLVCEECGGEAE
jgi:hypothetical protein